MNCPNCGKEIHAAFDSDKCPYCRFILKKKENNFDKNIYNFLKNDYLQTRNKIASIKKGMQRFGISISEAKILLDFIADEVYEDEHYRSSNEVNDFGKYDVKVFKFSFIQYFIRNMVYKIIFLFLLFFAGKQAANMTTNYNTSMLIFVGTMVSEVVLVIIFLFQWAIASTQKVIAESGTVIYVYKTPVDASGDELDRMSTSEVWGMSHKYYIEIIKEVIERSNRILVRGSIKQQNQKYHHLGITHYKKTALSEIKIPKYFKHNQKLLQMLYDYKH